MIGLDKLTQLDIDTCVMIMIDTRAYRCHLSKAYGYSADTTKAYVKPTTISKIDRYEIIPFLKSIQGLTFKHPIFYFKNSIEVPDNSLSEFWPFKYIFIWRIDNKNFTIRTAQFFQINWRNCVKVNLILDIPNAEKDI